MLLWLMITAQLIVWGWFSSKGGTLGDRKFLLFTLGMLAGQLAAGIDSFQQAAWKAFVVQVYFFAFTALGGVQRYRRMREKEGVR